MSNDVEDPDWDLSWLLQAPPAPAGGAERARRAGRRRRITRLSAAVTVTVVIIAVAVSAVAVSTERTSTRVTVGSGPAPIASPVEGRPTAALAGSTPFDWGPIRLWLPTTWSPGYGEACEQPMVGDIEQPDPGITSTTLAPCPGQDPAGYITVTSPGTTELPGTTPSDETINGLEAKISTYADETAVFVPRLGASLRAYGEGPATLLATLQPSAAFRLATLRTDAAPPAGWHQIVYDGLAFSVPSAWAVDDPPEGCGEPTPSVRIGVSTTGCPDFQIAGQADEDPPIDLVSLVSSTPDGAVPDPLSTSTVGRLTITATVAQDRPSAVILQILGGSQPLVLTVDVGTDPSVAQAILDSLRAAPAGQADTVVSCTPTSRPPMPTPMRLMTAETLGAAGEIQLDPPAPTAQPLVPASTLWDRTSTNAATIYQILLARIATSSAPISATSLAWVVVGRYKPPVGAVGCGGPAVTINESSALSSTGAAFGGTFSDGPAG